MVDLVIVPGNVVKGANGVVDTGTAGSTILAGQAVYFDTSVRKYLLADADSATVEARRATGIALNGASLNQPVTVQQSGDITIGSTVTPGVGYYLSGAAAGGICPVADIGTGEYVCLLGFAKSASVITIGVQFPGVAL